MSPPQHYSNDCSSMDGQEVFNLATLTSSALRPPSTTTVIPVELDDITGLPMVPMPTTAFSHRTNRQGGVSRNDIIDILTEALDLIDPNDFLEI